MSAVSFAMVSIVNAGYGSMSWKCTITGCCRVSSWSAETPACDHSACTRGACATCVARSFQTVVHTSKFLGALVVSAKLGAGASTSSVLFWRAW